MPGIRRDPKKTYLKKNVRFIEQIEEILPSVITDEDKSDSHESSLRYADQLHNLKELDITDADNHIMHLDEFVKNAKEFLRDNTCSEYIRLMINSLMLMIVLAPRLISDVRQNKSEVSRYEKYEKKLNRLFDELYAIVKSEGKPKESKSARIFSRLMKRTDRNETISQEMYLLMKSFKKLGSDYSAKWKIVERDMVGILEGFNEELKILMMRPRNDGREKVRKYKSNSFDAISYRFSYRLPDVFNGDEIVPIFSANVFFSLKHILRVCIWLGYGKLDDETNNQIESLVIYMNRIRKHFSAASSNAKPILLDKHGFFSQNSERHQISEKGQRNFVDEKGIIANIYQLINNMMMRKHPEFYDGINPNSQVSFSRYDDIIEKCNIAPPGMDGFIYPHPEKNNPHRPASEYNDEYDSDEYDSDEYDFDADPVAASLPGFDVGAPPFDFGSSSLDSSSAQQAASNDEIKPVADSDSSNLNKEYDQAMRWFNDNDTDYFDTIFDTEVALEDDPEAVIDLKGDVVARFRQLQLQ